MESNNASIFEIERFTLELNLDAGNPDKGKKEVN